MSLVTFFITHQGRPYSGTNSTPRLEAGESLVLGRSRSCDLVLPGTTISGRHAALSLRDDGLFAEDLSSTNGSYFVCEEQETKLPPGEPVPFDPRSSLRVGAFHLIPCESISEGLLLSSTPLTILSTEPETAAPTLAKPRSPALEALARALTSEESPWQALLDELVKLTRAKRAFLLGVSGERFVLRASSGRADPACISQQFLELTRYREGVLHCHPGRSDNSDKDFSSTSIMAYAPEVALTGLPFPDRKGGTVAIAYLESSGPASAPADQELLLFARSAGPVLETHIALDRETRRREALELSLGQLRGGAGPSADAVGAPQRVLGRSECFVSVIEDLRRAAPSGARILLRGPSGSGKEELARMAHALSPRSEQPFVAINSAALHEGLIESELFGHDRGAFTSAERTRAGAFENADGGTLFLDEIGDLALPAQAKILRCLETGEVVRLGGSRRRVDVRLIAATHRDLEAMVAEGSFREDLFFRLRVIELVLPSLADRHQDIPLLAEHFLGQFRRADGLRPSGLSTRATRALSRYAWPGNIRELRNVIERAVVLDQDGLIDIDDLPSEIAGDGASAAAEGVHGEILELELKEAVTRFEEIYLRRALEEHDWKIQVTADAIGIARRTLTGHISRLGLRE